MIIAVDFDGTISLGTFPYLGKPNMSLINKLKKAKKDGHQLILWTCRNGKYLEDAVAYCNSYGLEFDAINDDVPSIIDIWKDDRSKKICADIYIDDHSIHPDKFSLTKCKQEFNMVG